MPNSLGRNRGLSPSSKSAAAGFFMSKGTLMTKTTPAKLETKPLPITVTSQDGLSLDDAYPDDLNIKSVRAKRDARWMALKLNHGRALLQDMTHKIWRTAGGSKERPSHKAANGQKVGINEYFKVGGHKMFLPSDPDAPWAETANCRCDVEYVKEGKSCPLSQGCKPASVLRNFLTTISIAMVRQFGSPLMF